MTLARPFVASLLAGLALTSHAVALADVNVVVSSKPIHSLVASVMAGIGTPELLVSGSASPHAYSMKPSDAQKVNKADVFFRVSEGLEPFTAKVIASLPKSIRIVTLAEAPGLNLLERREGGTFEPHQHAEQKNRGHSHAHRNEKKVRQMPHDSRAYDAHIWLDPDNAIAMVRHVADVLAAVAPERASRIKANADAEIARITNLSRELERELKPVAGKPFAVYHDAYQYLEKRFGLNAVGSVTVSPDVPPSGKRLQDLRRRITALGALCVFAEPHFEPRVTNAVTEGTKARSGTLDPEGVTLPPGPDLYHVLMRNLAGNLKECLAASS
jgi:zinc transport system substrate-binding protein